MYWLIKVSAPYEEELASVGKQPDLDDLLGDFLWGSGSKIDIDLPVPLQFYLDPDAGDYLPAYFQPSIALMNEKMLSVLSGSGVDNIQSYEVDLYDRDNRKVNDKYFAINIVGRIECVDLEKSDYTARKTSKRMRFKKIIIDETKARGALLFRLHEKPSTVVIHDSIKQRLEKENLAGIEFKKAS